MLLITMHEWLGPGRKMTIEEKEKTRVIERHIAFATNMTEEDALKRISQYQRSYNDKFFLAVNFSLLNISTIRKIPEDILNNLQVPMIESLPSTVNEFE